MIGSIWTVGADGFTSNSAALAMVYITFYAIGATLLLMLTNLIGGRAKIAGWIITTLGGIACLGVFIKESKKIIEAIGSMLGL